MTSARRRLPPPPLRALVVMAHPDDIEFTCGGAVANLTDAGWRRDLLPRHQRGSRAPRTDSHAGPRPWRPHARSRASRRPPKVLGAVQRCLFLRWPDGFVEDTPELRERAGARASASSRARPAHHLGPLLAASTIATTAPSGSSDAGRRLPAWPAPPTPTPTISRNWTALPHRVNEIAAGRQRGRRTILSMSPTSQERKIRRPPLPRQPSQRLARDELAPAGAGPRRLRGRRGRERFPWAEGFRRLILRRDRSAPTRTGRSACAASKRADSAAKGNP